MNKRKACIMIVEDDFNIIRALQRSLVAHGYEVMVSHSGETALAMFAQHQPDLLLLDLGLPDISGLDICKHIRARSDLPIIVISVKDKERDKVRALDLGADDYVAKPFGIDEVLARIRVSLRHASLMASRTEPILTIGPMQIDVAQRLVSVDGKGIKLTPTEYDLLMVFITHRGKIVTQQKLLTEVWGINPDAKSSYLHVYIGQLRRKIEPDPTSPRFFQTISGVGYRFNEDS